MARFGWRYLAKQTMADKGEPAYIARRGGNARQRVLSDD